MVWSARGPKQLAARVLQAKLESLNIFRCRRLKSNNNLSPHDEDSGRRRLARRSKRYAIGTVIATDSALAQVSSDRVGRAELARSGAPT